MSVEDRAQLSTEQRSKYIESIVRLGLDLQGGMHLVLEVDDAALDDDAKKDAMDRTIKILRNRVDQFGVAEPIIQKQGGKRIIIQLPGLQDAERAKSLIGQTALLEFRLVRERQELARVLRDLDLALKGVRVDGAVVDTSGVEDTSEERAVDQPESGVFEEIPTTEELIAQADTPAVDTTSIAGPADSLFPPIPGAEEVEVPFQTIEEERPFTSYLISSAHGGVVVDQRNIETVDLLLKTPQAQRIIPRQSEFLWDFESRPVEGGGEGKVLYLVEKTATLTGRTLVNASTRPDPDNPAQLNVIFQLNREGALIFARFTGENIGRQIAIVLDRKIRSAPVVQTKIPGGDGRITGIGADEEAGDLAIVLRAGALPYEVDIKEERTVGPSLGHDSIVLGVRAAIIGFILVMLFMAVYYRLSGLLACAALVLNLIIILATLARLHAALTLPGIAGLILTIGMAIDANVLIFERIREELAKAKTVRSAIDSGYDRAFTTIFDANLTTLITAFVLYQFGTGPIKGFATTLSIGIVASMFTALLCTRTVFEFVTARLVLRKLSI
ncbi:MAG: protein translocase subunit SecD [Candidatus Latescibacteria bacterium]|nr:protein translocase subunit SecD [Candidatus Latescibacterota bacterium]NIM22614.1 protein translocase subunit SecD [Candidatus Latescibacterota bacterium]NIM64903.1 protein translocase subunit SecD [Candidatus Latescibacterota bacterium]NIO01418.1 protein translocase subunit SecD [Candidatus Latescibacterota bacterium]NIO27928.1 protein translocase subunit SecD [Candidatus Latescibacterota bacterium]